MKLFRRLFRDEVKEIIDLTRENENFKIETKNLMFLVYNLVQKKQDYTYFTTSLHGEKSFDYISQNIRNLVLENKKLKEELISKMNQNQKQDTHNIDDSIIYDDFGHSIGIKGNNGVS
jgi:hypothetical protein